MQQVSLTGPDAAPAAPATLEYGVARRVGCASIETYPDGVRVTAALPRGRFWLGVAAGAAFTLFMAAVAVPSSDHLWQGAGVSLRREGTVARVAAGLAAALGVAGIAHRLATRRAPTTLVARGGQFGYSEPTVRGTRNFSCPLREIRAVEFRHEHESVAEVRVTHCWGGDWLLFSELNAREKRAVVDALLPVWQAAASAVAA